MLSHRLTAVIGSLGLGLVLAVASAGRTQPDTNPPPAPAPSGQQLDPQDGEVLARGPLHEAFAGPVNAKPQATEVVPKQPPPAIEEVPPDQKPAGDNAQWFPGYWSWDETRNDFIWVSGVWRVPPPDRNWVPGHWDQAANGWQWTPGFWMQVQANNAQQGDNVEYLPPPPEPVDNGASTPAPNDQSVYAPGVWVYRENRYLWRPGFWIDYRPGWVWIPAHYVWTPVGYVFVDGYWDLELTRRGLCFAPVYFHRPVWTVAAWSYQPNYIVYNDFLMTALFVRPNCYAYYFGDYFEPAYRRRGFVAWVDFRLGGVGYDPLFSYYRWSHRDDRRAIADLREVYAARFSGRAERPPVTLAQQNTLIQNIQNNGGVTNITNITNITQVTALAPLSRVNQSVRLQPVSRAQRLQEQKFAQSVRQASVNRGKMETQLLSSQTVPSNPNSRPISARVNVPTPQVSANAGALQPPPPPRGSGGGLLSRPEGNRPTSIQGREDMRNGQQNQVRPENRPAERMDPRNLPQNQPRPENRPPVRTDPRNQPMPPNQPRNEPRPGNRPPVSAEPRNQPMPPNQPRVEPRPENRPVRTEPRNQPMPPTPPRIEPRPENRPPVRTEPRNEPAPQNPPRVEPRQPPRAEPPRQQPPQRPPMPPPNDKKGDRKG